LGFPVDDLSAPEVRALADEHVFGMRSQSPPESTHVLPAESFADPAVTLWTAWRSDQLVGCGAVKHLDADNAETKSMRVPQRFTRQGIGRAILDHLVSFCEPFADYVKDPESVFITLTV
jgi:putative acetyltransferase